MVCTISSPIKRALVCLSQSLLTVNTTSVKLSYLDIFTIKYVNIQAHVTQRAHVLSKINFLLFIS